MARETIPEQVFFDHIKKLVTNLLDKNINYDTDYYFTGGRGIRDLIKDNREASRYIIECMENEKHLINL